MDKPNRLYRRSKARETSKTMNDLEVSDLFTKFINTKLTEGLSSRTINDYKVHFKYLTHFIGENLVASDLTVDLLQSYIGYMLNDLGVSPVTANVRIRTIRAFLRYCFIKGYTPPIYEEFKPVKTEEDTIQSFTPKELKLLFSHVDEGSFIGYRDKIIMFVFLDTMVRCSELINIKLANVDLNEGTIYLEASITKTRRARTVPISNKTIRMLTDYINEISVFNSPYLFVTYEGNKISDNTVRRNISNYGKLANITNKRVSPHTFRHTGALFYIMNGGDPFSLQKILGHSDMSTVRKYIQMTNADVKRQHNNFSPLNLIL